MEEAFSELSDSLEDVRRKFFGVFVGEVVSLNDPLPLGRVQVKLRNIDANEPSPWARVAVPMAGLAHGTYFIPNVHDEVLVAFEQGNLNAPYIVGSLWTASAAPPQESPLKQIREIRTPIGNEIIFSDLESKITIKPPEGPKIEMSPTSVQITLGSSVIDVAAEGITLKGAKLALEATTDLVISAPKVTIDGKTTTTVKSGGICTVQGTPVKIN